jgi:DNA polymerase
MEVAMTNRGARLRELQAAAADCKACDLYKNATQTVFGEGPPQA